MRPSRSIGKKIMISILQINTLAMMTMAILTQTLTLTLYSRVAHRTATPPQRRRLSAKMKRMSALCAASYLVRVVRVMVVSVDDVNYCHMLNVCALAASFTPQLFILDIHDCPIVNHIYRHSN